MKGEIRPPFRQPIRTNPLNLDESVFDLTLAVRSHHVSPQRGTTIVSETND